MSKPMSKSCAACVVVNDRERNAHPLPRRSHAASNQLTKASNKRKRKDPAAKPIRPLHAPCSMPRSLLRLYKSPPGCRVLWKFPGALTCRIFDRICRTRAPAEEEGEEVEGRRG